MHPSMTPSSSLYLVMDFPILINACISPFSTLRGHMLNFINSYVFLKVSEYDQKYHTHKLQTNPPHSEEELKGLYRYKTSKRQ